MLIEPHAICCFMPPLTLTPCSGDRKQNLRQEQEEEKEVELDEAPPDLSDGLPISHNDIAYSREDEQQHRWSLDKLATVEDASTPFERWTDEADKSRAVSRPVLRPLQQFTVHMGQSVKFPRYMWISVRARGWTFKPSSHAL